MQGPLYLDAFEYPNRILYTAIGVSMIIAQISPRAHETPAGPTS